MQRAPNFKPARPTGSRPQTTRGAADFLQADNKMSALLPTAMRMAALQKDCAEILPAMFDACAVLQFESAQLVLSTPNAALASRLKQQLPKLQSALSQRGWQVNAVRLKVQVTTSLQKPDRPKQAILPARAVSALSELGDTLEKTPRNAGLLAALDTLVRRHRRG